MSRVSRYTEKMVRTPAGRGLGTAQKMSAIRRGIRNSTIAYTTVILKEGERIDHVAHRHYGNAALWWVIAAASNIGWAMQVPPGTVLKVPDSLSFL